jgi:pyruvate kinase
VIPLYFDVTAFQPEDLDARILEFLLDGGYLRRGDFLLLTIGSTAGEAGKTNQMKILTVE